MTNQKILFLFISIFLISCGRKQEKIKPTLQKITESVYASGIIKSNNQYKVYSTVNGAVSKIMVNVGDLVTKGDEIIKLVNTGAQLKSANAALATKFTSTKNNAEKLEELQIATNLAKAKMNEDALLQQKQLNLRYQNIGTKNELAQRQLAYKTSVTNYQSAKLRYTLLQKQINFEARQSQNNLQIASTIKNDYTIKSNADGRVYSILLKQGEIANTTTPLAIIGDANNFMMELQVDEFDINRLKTGQNIILSMDSYKGQVFDATVTKINPIMNEKSKSFTVEAVFVKQPKTLYPNLTCEANIIIKHKDKTITIPRNYLLAGDSVWIEKNKKQKVRVGLKDYKKVEILSGLTVNDFIYKPAL